MTRSICHVAKDCDAGKRLDAFLAEHGFYASRSAAARAVAKGCVLVAGDAVAKKYSVRAGDAIVCILDEEPEDLVVSPQPIDLDIRYEDDDVIVLSKQAGLVCHPSIDHADGTLVNALLYHCGRKHLCNVQGEDDRLGIVHRLDGDTSGLMIAAKTDVAGTALMEDIRIRAVDRRYLCLVHGIMAHDTGMIDAPIARSANERTRMAVRDCPSSREAITTFRVLERFEASKNDNGYTFVECKLYTGRTHQIRVHMQYTRHPVVGDLVYDSHAPRTPLAQLGLCRQFLHSYRLAFTHPMSGETLTFADNLASDLARVLCDLGSRSMGKTQAGFKVEEALSQAPHPAVEGVSYGIR